MCDDETGPAISRRTALSTGAAAAAASVGVLGEQAPAQAAQRTVQRICRSAWGAEPPSGTFERHTISRMTVHHSAVLLAANTDAPRHLRAYQNDHQSLDWPDIAYHLAIDLHGNVYQLRPLWTVGDTRTSYDPAGHLLVLCIGNFEQQTVPAAQLNATADVLAWASTRFGVSPRTIRGHRDFAQTSCPGEDLYRYITDGTLRRRVARRTGTVAMTDLCGLAGQRRVRRIENGTD